MVDAPQTIGLVGIPFGWRLWSSDIDGSEMYGVVRYVLHSDYATLEAENARLRARVDVMEKACVVTDEMVERAEAAVYKRHERGFLMKPLITAINMRAALEAALTPTKENDNAE